MTTIEPLPRLPRLFCSAGQHVWLEEFSDGGTCQCGRFYLDLHPANSGARAEVVEAEVPE